VVRAGFNKRTWQFPKYPYKYSMRSDLGGDRPDDRGLDPQSVRRIQEVLKQDPRQRISGMRRVLMTIIWLMMAAALLVLCGYYGYALWSGLKAGNQGEQRYRQMIKENSGD
jgi:hypothetical protein